MEIALTPEQSVRIRLLSDGPMYEDAVDLAAEQQAIIAYRQFGHQVNGLQQHARSFKELREFVKHQRTRDWEGKSQSFEGFYTAVDAYLNDVCNAVQEEYSFVPEGLTKNE